MDMNREYANMAFIPNAGAILARIEAAAKAYWDNPPFAAEDIAYGAHPRQTLRLCRPEGPAKGVLVFIHGGYWLSFSPADWAHLAHGALKRGWAAALPGYILAPEARVSAIRQDLQKALSVIAAKTTGPMVLTGHSAGGQLAARLACADAVQADWRLKRVVPISPVGELEPMLANDMNADLKLDAAEVEAESPTRHTLAPGVAAHVWVGHQERPAFLWQARLLAERWDCPWSTAPGRNHFDVIEDLAQPDSALMDLLLGA